MLNRIKQIFGVKAQNNKSKLARDLGMNTRTVTQYVEGESKPSVDFLVNILRVYTDISAEWLMRGEGDMLRTKTEKSRQNENMGDLGELLKTIQFLRETCEELKAKLAVYEAKKQVAAV